MFNKKRASPSAICARCARVSFSSGNFFSVKSSARDINVSKSSVDSGCNTPM